MLQFSRSVWLSWKHLLCFHCSSWSPSKFIAEKLLVTYHYLKWPWRHDEGSLVVIFWFRVSILPITQCLRVLRMVFFQKRCLLFFSHWLKMDRAKLTWPWVTDIQIPRNAFYRYWHWYQSLKGSRWSDIRCSLDKHSNFFLRWGDLTWPDLDRPGSEIFTCAKKMYKRYTKNSSAVRRLFLDICEKPEGLKTLPPARPGLNKVVFRIRTHCSSL